MQISLLTGESITAILAAAVATTNPKAIIQRRTRAGISTDIVALTDDTAVALLTSVDAAGDVLEGLSICNIDTVAVTLTLNKKISSTSYPIVKSLVLSVGDTLVIGTDGLYVMDSSGRRKTTAAATVPAVLASSLNITPGASTAAAGSTYADAGALPAGTAAVYPTTAADDTKGVIVSTSDKITGNTLFIGNGVSNKILKVYAPAGGTINGAAANTAFSSVSGKGVTMYCLNAGANTWLAW